jgi:predicted aspartyl protease
MITGMVNANREATIRLVVSGPSGQQQEIEAIIDTGFTGFLTLPPALIQALGLAWLCRNRACWLTAVLRFSMCIAPQ